MRLETLDALDKLPQLVNSDELKIKLLFSVMVVSAFFAKQMPVPVKNCPFMSNQSFKMH